MTVKRITDSSYIVTFKAPKGALVGPAEYVVITRYTQGWALTLKDLETGREVRQIDGWHATLEAATEEAENVVYGAWCKLAAAERRRLAGVEDIIAVFVTTTGHGGY